MASKVFLFFALIFFFSFSSSGYLLTITESMLPHFQTFDSWPLCFYQGTCYEQACPDLNGGWNQLGFHPGGCCGYSFEERNWWVNFGETESNIDNTVPSLPFLPCAGRYTGPCEDHTMNNSSGKYMYAEASACFGVYFEVSTPTFVFTANMVNVSFWYYMFGADLDRKAPGQLAAFISFDNGTTYQVIANFTGQQQTVANEPWFQWSEIVDPLFPTTPSVINPVSVLFLFRAIAPGFRTGNNEYWRGDIAIDDFFVTQAGATGPIVPYVDPPPTPPPSGPTSHGGDGDGISGGQIAGIVVGVVGGLCLLCCCLLLLLLLLLLLISPRKPGGSKKAEEPDPDAL